VIAVADQGRQPGRAAGGQGHPGQQRGARPDLDPLIPATMPQGQVASFGQEVLMKRPGQPIEGAISSMRTKHGEAGTTGGGTGRR
jgi:hypothetical protein